MVKPNKMQKNKLLLGLCIIIFLLIPLSFAAQSNYETSTVSRIVGESPWSSFAAYKEEPTKSYVLNDYPLKIAEFVKKKCNGCKDTMLLGDGTPQLRHFGSGYNEGMGIANAKVVVGGIPERVIKPFDLTRQNIKYEFRIIAG